MAMHRATPVVASVLPALGDSIEDMTKSQSIVSSGPVSDAEW